MTRDARIALALAIGAVAATLVWYALWFATGAA